MAKFQLWCWTGDPVYYGILLDSGQEVTRGRLDPQDIDNLVDSHERWTFTATEPEEVGMQRVSKDCCACNEYKYPPCDGCTDDLPKILIERLLNDFNPNDPSKTDINLEVVPVSEIDRIQLMKIEWTFGDGTTEQFEGINGQRVGYRRTHSYPFGSFSGNVVLSLLDNETRNVLESDQRTFEVVVNETRPELPLSLIVDLLSIEPEEAPATVTLQVIGNQAYQNLVVDWNDGSDLEVFPDARPDIPISHFYLFGGNYNIFMTAESRIDGNQGSKRKTVNVPGEPNPDSIIGGIDPKLLIGGLVASGIIIGAVALSKRKKRSGRRSAV